MHRRKFIKSSLVSGISLYGIPALGSSLLQAPGISAVKPVGMRLSLDVPCKLFDGKSCWSHPRAGIIPRTGQKNNPRVIMAMYKLNLSGNDIFTGTYCLDTDGPDKPWTTPAENNALGFRPITLGDQTCRIGVQSLWPGWHSASGKLLATGATGIYTMDWKAPSTRYRRTAFAVYNDVKKNWQPWQVMDIPDAGDLEMSSAEGTQRYDDEDGTILIPVAYKAKGNSGVAVLRCKFDGEHLTYLAHGSLIRHEDKTRGLGEPSVTKFNGTYYLTIRHNETGFVTTSKDGLNYQPITNWQFDDSTDLGSYNTQQHWVTHSDGLFLIYTRRGANNDNVFRNRAPLFMAQVDPERLCVIRHTEQILMPNKGARYGNFGVTAISPDETWVTESEWMQPKGCEKYGSDGRVYIARIHWKKPNKLFKV